MMSDVGYRVHRVLHGVVIAALELADGDDHVQFFCAETGESSSFLTEGGDERSAEGESDDYADGNAGAGEDFDGSREPTWG